MKTDTAHRPLEDTPKGHIALPAAPHDAHQEASGRFDPEAYRECVARIQLPNAERVLSQVEFAGNEKVLDIGCGEGMVTAEALVPKIPHGMIIGIDNNPDMLALAERSWREPAFQLADVRRMEATFQKERLPSSFDVVFSNFVLHWMVDPPSHRLALQNIKDMMRPGGIAVISFLDAQGFGEFHDAARVVSELPEWRDMFKDMDSREFLSCAEFKGLVLQEGFRGDVNRTETWVSFEDIHELKRCFMTLWRNYMSCLPSREQQETFADAVLDYYQSMIKTIADYPPERGGISIRQRTIDAHLLHGNFTN